jgi:hypothetical protein
MPGMRSDRNDEIEHVEAEITSALGGILARRDKGLLIKWVLTAETMSGESGLPTVWSIASRDCQPWDILGLLEYMRTQMKVHIAEYSVEPPEASDDHG